MSKRNNKGPSHPKEFFALGTKLRADLEKSVTNTNSNILPKKSSLSNLSTLKSDGVAVPPKKTKILGNVIPAGASRQIETEHRSSPTSQMYLYEDIAIDVDGHELLDSILEASTSDCERVEGLICGAIRQIKINRNRMDRSIYLTLIYLAKTRSELYQSDIIIEAICSLLKRDMSVNIKIKGNSSVAILACNIFMAAFQHIDNWPESLIKAYLEDCLGDRTWVDRSECRIFVENIMTAFNTKLGSINIFNVELLSKADIPINTAEDKDGGTVQNEESIASVSEASVTMLQKPYSDSEMDGCILNRFSSPQQQSSIETYVLEVIRDQLSRRMPLDGGSRNLVRTMTVVCIYAEVRTLAAHRLEMWLTSPKLTRSAQDLLMAVCMNCNPQQHQQDIDLLNLLSRIRLKTKSLSNHYILCIRELLGPNNENLPVLLAQMITNELSAIRNPNNMTFISVIFHQASDISAKLLAEAFLDCLSNREDYLRQLRLLLREIVRCVKQDFNFSSFVFSLLQDRSIKMRDIESSIKEKFVYGVIDVICLSVLLCCNPSIKEAASSLNKSETKNFAEIELVRNYQKQVMFMMRDAVWWLETIAIKLCPPKTIDYLHCLRKVVFMESHDQYFKIDGWPAEGERGLMLKLASDMPLMGDALLRILRIATNRELQLKPVDMLDLIEAIVKRAAFLHTDDGNFPVLKVHNLEIIEMLLSLSIYRHPENTVLPKSYQPPPLAITSLYWKSCTILLIISAFNPTTIGLKIWTCYPTLKCLMEMIMTNNFTFPPPTMSYNEMTAENFRAKERQMSEYCKQQTLEFECHLASSTITEANSRLVQLVVRYEPMGFVLRPGQEITDKMKQLNQSLHLGLLLCQSREPADFLLSIIQQQGSSESMPWLIDLIECNESSLDILPVQCLCEFLLHGILIDDSYANIQKSQKHDQLVLRLQNLICNSSINDPKNVELIGQALTFFFKKLNAPKASARKQASLALAALLATDDVELDNFEKEIIFLLPNYKWLLHSICQLSHFQHFKKQICSDLRTTWQIETDSLAISAYTIFIHLQTKDFELSLLDEIALDLATMVVERSIMLNHILPQEGGVNRPLSHLVQAAIIGIFNNYISKIQHLKNETIEWENTQDQIRVQWVNGRSAQMNIIVVHAMTIVLSYGQPHGDSEFNDLLDIWFPISEPAPTAFLVDTMEEALIFPDWLKLKMIRSPVHRLVDAALMDLEPQQLLLFVQSFGIPVVSMTRLLTLLDACMQSDATSVEKQIVDKTYMSQLVDVQRQRGASGGEIFYSMLITGSQKDDDFEMKEVCQNIGETLEIKIKLEHSKEQISNLLHQVFVNLNNLKAMELYVPFKELQKFTLKVSLHCDIIDCFNDMIASNKFNMEQFFSSTFSSSLLNSLCIQEIEKFYNLATNLVNLCPVNCNKSPLSNFLNNWIKNYQKKKNKINQISDTNITASPKMSITNTLFDQPIDGSNQKIMELFSKESNGKKGKGNYLLSQLIHQSHFNELTAIIDILVNNTDSVNKFDATKVLDFLKACLELPPLWRGRDQHEQKNYTKEDIFGFNKQQIISVIQYIIKEQLNLHDPCLETSDISTKLLDAENGNFCKYGSLQITYNENDMDSNDDSNDKLMQLRLDFLSNCCASDMQLNITAFEYLLSEASIQNQSYICLKMFNQFFLNISSLMKLNITKQIINSSYSSCPFDMITHCVINELMSDKNDEANKSRSKYMILLKIGSQHPNVLLRQLPLIVALLQGRLQYSTRKLNENIDLFAYILGILEILQPQLFSNLYIQPLKEIIAIYIQFFKIHTIDKSKFGPLINKFCKMLLLFIRYDMNLAVNSIKPFEDTLRTLEGLYSTISTIKEILSFMLFPSILYQSNDANNTIMNANLLNMTQNTYEQYTYGILSKNITEWQTLATSKEKISVIQNTLKEIEKISKMNADILEQFVTNIKDLLKNGESVIFETVFKLMLRLVTYKPSYAKEFVSIYKECIQKSDSVIQKYALNNLKEFTILAIDDAQELLLAVFNLGVKNNIDVFKYISETVKLLNNDFYTESK